MSGDGASPIVPAAPGARADDQPDPPVVSEYQPDDVDPEEIVHVEDASTGSVLTDQGDALEAADTERIVDPGDDGV